MSAFGWQERRYVPSSMDAELWRKRVSRLHGRRLGGAVTISLSEQPVMRTVLLGFDILARISGREVTVRQGEAEIEELEVLHESEDND